MMREENVSIWPRIFIVFIVKPRGAGLLSMILPQICPCSAGLFAVLCKLKK